MCVCVNTSRETSSWCLMEAVSGQTGITLSCIQHISQVYLKKNRIRIIMTRMQKKNCKPNVIVFIWLVSMVTGFIKSKRKSYATLWYIVAMDFLPKHFWSTKTRTKTSCFTSILILVIKTKTKP